MKTIFVFVSLLLFLLPTFATHNSRKRILQNRVQNFIVNKDFNYLIDKNLDDKLPPPSPGNPCIKECTANSSSPECASCCRTATHRVDWKCSGTSSSHATHGDLKRDDLSYFEKMIVDWVVGEEIEEEASCCTDWKGECWNERSEANHFHACMECCGTCSCGAFQTCCAGCDCNDDYCGCPYGDRCDDGFPVLKAMFYVFAAILYGSMFIAFCSVIYFAWLFFKFLRQKCCPPPEQDEKVEETYKELKNMANGDGETGTELCVETGTETSTVDCTEEVLKSDNKFQQPC